MRINRRADETHVKRSEHAQLAGESSQTLLLVVREHLVPGDEGGVQVADGASGSEDAVALLVADDLSHVAHRDLRGRC